MDNLSLLCKNTVCDRVFHSDKTVWEITWEDSDLRNWLNSEFYSSFSEEEKSKMLAKTRIAPEHDDEYWREDEHDTEDKVYLLSKNEVYKLDEEMRKCGDYWWIRNLATKRGQIMVVREDGAIRGEGFWSAGESGVRPAITLRID